MATRTPPFAAFEWMIAWRYLRARRAEGGVSVMTWISLIGITLAVFALIATLAVRAGFRAEFVDTILGANAHVTVYSTPWEAETGQTLRTIQDYDAMAERLRGVAGVTRAAPLIKGQAMATHQGRNAGVQVFGIRSEDLRTLPRIAPSDKTAGDIARFDQGIAVGSGLASWLASGRIVLLPTAIGALGEPNGVWTSTASVDSNSPLAEKPAWVCSTMRLSTWATQSRFSLPLSMAMRAPADRANHSMGRPRCAASAANSAARGPSPAAA